MWVGAAIWAGIRWSVGGKAAIEVIVGRGGRIEDFRSFPVSDPTSLEVSEQWRGRRGFGWGMLSSGMGSVGSSLP